MRIAWFTPFSRSSAIGMVGRRVAEELAADAEVTIWTADPRQELLQTRLPVIHFAASPEAAAVAREYDAAVYHFGDSYPFHRDIYLMSQMAPGVAVLHDFVMHHFFASHFLDQLRAVEAYRGRMAAFYGEEGLRAFESYFRRTEDGWDIEIDAPLWSTDDVIRFPFFEEAMRGASGVVVHSEFFRQQVAKATVTPVRRLYLPAVQSMRRGKILSRERLGIPAGRSLLLTVGVVNRNKQAHAIVESLARRPDVAGRIFYALIGYLEEGTYVDSLRAAIERHGLTDSIKLLGRRSDQELNSWLTHADLCINLRNPVMEGASGSLADQLMHSKAVIVSDAGVFAELPDDCVRKIVPGREEQDAADVIAGLLDDPDERLAMGQRAHAYAAAHFRADQYAAELLKFLHEIEGTSVMMRYADRLASTLREMGVRPGMPILKTLADESALLFGDPVTSPWRLDRE